MPSPQSAYAIALCTAGVFAVAVARYQIMTHQIGKVRLVSPRAKHLTGLVCILFGVLMLATQLMAHR
jgi:hypothetical protein